MGSVGREEPLRRRASWRSRRWTSSCCQVKRWREVEEQDDGGQRGEAAHDSDSDHPVWLGPTGLTTDGDPTEHWLLQVFPGHRQDSSAGSWHHLYGMCRSCKDNRPKWRLLWSGSQSLLPLRRRHHLHRHPHLDLLLSASSERYNKGEAAVYVHDAGGDLHVGGDSGVHHRLDRDLVRVWLVPPQPQDQQHHLRRQGGGGG